MEQEVRIGILESLLFAAGDEGLSLEQICNAMEIEESVANELLDLLKDEYETNHKRGIMLVLIAETYQLATKRSLSKYLKKLAETPHQTTLSQASLETLAIIAYKQPITRIEIEEIRGVKTERPIQTLITRGLIQDVGRVEGTGRAILYGTTKEFLDYFGLTKIEDLPELDEEETETEDEADLFFSKFES